MDAHDSAYFHQACLVARRMLLVHGSKADSG
jgi:hypothetical protein